jgi:2-C-methyl-D-erythritol 4-phosphate cytidylyltransferase
LEVLAAAGCSPLVVVVPAESVADTAPLLGRFEAELVISGPSRQDSVARGIERVRAERVVIHDAARPFVTVADVRRVAEALARVDGAVMAVPLEDTLKRVKDERIVETVDRASLWRAQTPQAFRTEVLRAAHERALREGFEGTDDAQLLERCGAEVAVVPGSRRNLKLTFAEDFSFAEALMQS